MWRDLLGGADILHFIDQDAARFNLIRGYAGGDVAAGLVEDLWREDSALGCKSWFERVQTDANLADAASRDQAAVMDRVADRVEVPADLIRSIMQ